MNLPEETLDTSLLLKYINVESFSKILNATLFFEQIFIVRKSTSILF